MTDVRVGPIRLAAFTLPRLWLTLAIVGPVVAAFRTPLAATDLAYAIRAGRLVAASGTATIPESMAFPLAGTSWQDHQWLAHLLLAGIDSVGGWPLQALVRAALIGLTVGIVLVGTRRAGVSDRTAALLAFAAFLVAAPALAMRAQLFAIVLFAATSLIVSLRISRPRLPWLVPILTVAWVNTHGTFPFALALLAVALLADRLAGRPVRQLLAVTGATALATVLNPWGIGAWTYPLRLPFAPILRVTEEWRMTPLDGLPGWAFYLSLLGLIVLIARASWRVRAARGPRPLLPLALLPRLAWVAALGALAVAANRGVAWYALEAAPFAAGLIAAPAARPSGSRSWPGIPALNVAITALLVGLAIASLPILRPVTVLDATKPEDALLTYAPADLSAAVNEAARPGDRLFVPQAWGSWFELDAPAVPVYVDSRLELFPPSTWDDYRTIEAGGAGATRLLGTLGVTLVAIGPDESVLLGRLGAAGWAVVQSGPSGVLLRAPQTAVVTQ